MQISTAGSPACHTQLAVCLYQFLELPNYTVLPVDLALCKRQSSIGKVNYPWLVTNNKITTLKPPPPPFPKKVCRSCSKRGKCRKIELTYAKKKNQKQVTGRRQRAVNLVTELNYSSVRDEFSAVPCRKMYLNDLQAYQSHQLLGSY